MKINLTSINDKLDSFMNISDLKFRQIGDTLDSINNNHLMSIQANQTKLEKIVNVNSTDLKWVKKIQWYSVTLGVSTLVGIIVTIYLTIK